MNIVNQYHMKLKLKKILRLQHNEVNIESVAPYTTVLWFEKEKGQS